MDDEQRISQQIDKGMTRKQACMTLGIAYKPEKITTKTDKETLRNMAVDTLFALIQDMQTTPSSYKPTEIIAACKEALDRTEGKAAQSMTIDTSATVTHEYIMKLPPDEAYRQLIEGGNMLIIDQQGEG